MKNAEVSKMNQFIKSLVYIIFLLGSVVAFGKDPYTTKSFGVSISSKDGNKYYKIIQKEIAEATVKILKSDAHNKEEKIINSDESIEIFPKLDGYYIITVNIYNQETKRYIRLTYNLDEKFKFVEMKQYTDSHVKHLLPLFEKLIKA
jgi:hypothetical protein